MADPVKDNVSDGAEEQDGVDTGLDDDFNGGFADDDDSPAGGEEKANESSEEEDEDSQDGEPAADDDSAEGAGDKKDESSEEEEGAPAGEEVQDEKGEAAKALEERVNAKEQAAAEDAFWKHLNSHYDGDVRKVVNSDEFWAWVEKQDASVQAAVAQNGDPAAALKVIESYDSAQQKQQQEATLNVDVADFIKRANIGDLELGEGDEMESLMDFATKSYPENATFVTAIALAAKREAVNEMKQLMKESGFMSPTDVQALIDGKLKIQTLHNDADDVLKSPGYKQWLEKQPKGVQQMAESSDAEDQEYVIRAYKEHAATGKKTPAQEAAEKKKAEAAAKKKAVLAAQIDDRTGGGGGSGGQDDKDDFMAGFADDDD